MKASPEEEGRIIAQSRFDVNEEMRRELCFHEWQRRMHGGRSSSDLCRYLLSCSVLVAL
jgi:hypothetical protein